MSDDTRKTQRSGAATIEKPAQARGIANGRYIVVELPAGSRSGKGGKNGNGGESKKAGSKARPDKGKPKGGGRPKDGEGDFWTYNPNTGDTEPEQWGCKLQDEDVITCYDPEDEDPDAEPAVESFAVQDTDTGTIVVEYDCGEGDDSLEVDLSALEVFEENYDTGSDQPYECSDSTGSFGING